MRYYKQNSLLDRDNGADFGKNPFGMFANFLYGYVRIPNSRTQFSVQQTPRGQLVSHNLILSKICGVMYILTSLCLKVKCMWFLAFNVQLTKCLDSNSNK